MSRLEELIGTLCPDGVIYRPVKDVYRRLKGTSITARKMKEIEDPEGDIKVFAGGKTVINTNEEDIPNANIIRTPAVLVQSRGIIDVIYYDKPFTFKNEMWAYTYDDVAPVKFLYYVLKNNIQKFRDAASGMGSMPQISLPVTEEFMMPVPPLEVQREIVRILDNFTELTEELTEELTARKQQYEYYRNKLFKIESGEIKSLGEICKFKYGEGNTIPETTGKYPVYGCNGIIGHTDRYNNENTPIIGHIGSAGIVNWASGKNFVTYNGTICKANESIVQPRYLYYLLTQLNLTKYVKGNQPFLSYGDISKIKTKIPSLEEQERTVIILDYFDSICSDFNTGLPAEIEARQKQYAYYRDKLLTFKRKTA